MDLGFGFTPNYLSCEDILSTGIKIKCRVEVNIPKFGFLDPSLTVEDLPPGSEIELPLWAAAALAKRRYITVLLPTPYSESFREVIKADPSLINMTKKAPYFYQTGLHLAALPIPHLDEVDEILVHALQKRLFAMFDSYTYKNPKVVSEEENRLDAVVGLRENFMDELELKIFNDAHQATSHLHKYLGIKRY